MSPRLSASGAIIEPQRLEGCFYRSLTALSAFMFYISLVADLNTVFTFALIAIYPRSYWVISVVILCLPTALVSFNTFRNLYLLDFKKAMMETGIVIFQLSSFFQARYAVTNR